LVAVGHEPSNARGWLRLPLAGHPCSLGFPTMAASPPSPPSPAPPSLLLRLEPSTPARQRSLPTRRPPGRSQLADPLLGFYFGRAYRPIPCSCSSPHPLTCRVLGRRGTLILRRRLIAVLVRPYRSCPTHFPIGIKSLLLFIRMFLCELGGGEDRNSSASHTLCLMKCLNQNLSSHLQFGLIMVRLIVSSPFIPHPVPIV
jgi:hypothetical protein